jgi:hypothetical protein
MNQHPTASPLTLCNGCDANTANPNDPGGYCDECRNETEDDTFRKGEQVRYIGQNAEHGTIGTVRTTDVIGGEIKVDTCFPARGKRCGYRRLIAPQNLERLSA